ncbi:MAG: glycerophosphodiester phosphodiesterase [Gammaproteobacteria bacterium]|nr:glycerophosphodiester phosphodiesterase [Gammaproteobacteria bacterium]
MSEPDALQSQAVPMVIAHRGDAANFPENSIAALAAAAACGVQYLEFDIQLSADRVPLLLHDESLLRTAGVDQVVTACVSSELQQVCVGEKDRFGDQFSKEKLPTLEAALAALPSEKLTLFVELKRQSLRAFGRRRVLDAVLPLLRASQHDVVLVSFDAKVLSFARERSSLPIGFVLSSYDQQAITDIVQLAPEFVFCNQRRLPSADIALWCGNWDWVIYEIAKASQARSFYRRGARFVESHDACRLAAALRQ